VEQCQTLFVYLLSTIRGTYEAPTVYLGSKVLFPCVLIHLIMQILLRTLRNGSRPSPIYMKGYGRLCAPDNRTNQPNIYISFTFVRKMDIGLFN
jgi:hypothetical protein